MLLIHQPAIIFNSFTTKLLGKDCACSVFKFEHCDVNSNYNA